MFSLNNPIISYGVAALVALALATSAISWLRYDATADLRRDIAAATRVAEAENAADIAAIEREGADDAAALVARNLELEAHLAAARRIIAEREAGKCTVSLDTVRALNAQR